MEPLVLKPIYKEKPWGSKKILKQVKGESREEKIGESWEIALDENNINNFENINLNMKDIFLDKKMRKNIFGKKYINYEKLPILIKTLFIDGKLSLQIHPNNKFAKKNENDLGKNETWYVLYADENTYVNIGLKKKISKKKLENLIKENKIANYLKKVKIKPGDIINILPGTIHSVCGKAVLYEVQQNSNVTYRIYDSNGRKLDIEKAINVFKNNNINVKNKKQGILIKNKYYKLKRIKIIGKQKLKTHGSFAVIKVLEGNGKIISNKNTEINKGMTILIPASLKNYIISGNVDLLITN